MSNLSTALALILAAETPNMDCAAIGDTHLPVARQAHGRMQIRKTVLDDLTRWSHGTMTWKHADSHNPNLDVLMANWYLTYYCGPDATLRRYLTTWNGGPQGRVTTDAAGYFRRCVAVKRARPDHFEKCKHEVERVLK